ncbi:HalOD1 output domain-containing protein [Haloarcula brevis]|uniref:HalOD1 output domain-containing protein n=1 Tax=Haloarcula brevis TaxID=3111453 RepID=UPI00300F1304
MTDSTEDGGIVDTVTEPYESITDVLVRAVSTANDCDPLDLPPLAETVDGDVLEALFPAPDNDLTVSFEFAGKDVVVQSPATVYVQPSYRAK